MIGIAARTQAQVVYLTPYDGLVINTSVAALGVDAALLVSDGPSLESYSDADKTDLVGVVVDRIDQVYDTVGRPIVCVARLKAGDSLRDGEGRLAIGCCLSSRNSLPHNNDNNNNSNTLHLV